MKSILIAVLAAFTGVILVSVQGSAHHGTGISYDRSKEWRGKVVVTEFRYANPHPQLFFDRTDEKGNVVHWVSELNTNPSRMLRAGWTRKRSEEVLKPGTQVILTIAPSKAGEASGLVIKIENEQGEEIASGPAGGPAR